MLCNIENVRLLKCLTEVFNLHLKRHRKAVQMQDILRQYWWGGGGIIDLGTNSVISWCKVSQVSSLAETFINSLQTINIINCLTTFSGTMAYFT